MRTCSQCRFAVKMIEAFDSTFLYCGVAAQIDGRLVGFVSGEEAESCGSYEAGLPAIEDELVPVVPSLVQIHSAGVFAGAGN